LKCALLAINPLYIIGYTLGARLSLLMTGFSALLLLPVLLLAVVKIPQMIAVSHGTVLLEGAALATGLLGGTLRRNLRDGFEIYYLSTTSGRVSAFSLFCSSTYLHILALAGGL
jgi:hypothetical protein